LHERRGDRSENANDKQDYDQLDQCGSFGETRLPLFDLLQFFFATDAVPSAGSGQALSAVEGEHAVQVRSGWTGVPSLTETCRP